MGLFSRKRDQPLDAQQVVDEFHRTAATASAGAMPARGIASIGGFAMTVEDVFAITGRGTVVTGRVASGEVHGGQTVTLFRAGAALRQVEVTAIEMFRKTVTVARAGDNVGLLLKSVSRSDVQQGDQLA